MDLRTKRSRSPIGKANTFKQQAYHLIKTRIMNRELRPSQYITDSQIAKQLNISRTPVREALHLLEHEGLLTRQTKPGWKIHSLSLEDINEIFDVKVALEGMMVRRAAESVDEGKRTALRNTMGRMKQAASVGDHEAWRQADIELHHTISDMCGNERASRIISDLNDQWYRLRVGLVAMEGRVERSNHEHEEIVSYILDGRGIEAEHQMFNHLNNLRQELVRVLVNLVLPFAENGI